MQPDDKRWFQQQWRLLITLYQAYDRVSHIADYWYSLVPFSKERVEAAISGHMQCPKQGPFFPKPVDLIRRMGQNEADNAWSNVMARLYREGRYLSTPFEEPLTVTVLTQIGGWGRLCQLSSRELESVAVQFKDAYQKTWHTKARFSTVLPECVAEERQRKTLRHRTHAQQTHPLEKK